MWVFLDLIIIRQGSLKQGKLAILLLALKMCRSVAWGDTITLLKTADEADMLTGYKEVKPMVFAGIFPKEGNEYPELRDAIEKLKLNDAALVYEAEHSQALGFGFRCGFLGILHLEIFQERLKREYGLELIVTLPSVAYKVFLKNGEDFVMRTPQQFPAREAIEYIEEPWVTLDVISPKDYIGNIMQLVQEKRGIYKNTEYIDEQRAILHYDIPMSAILTDFYDKIKGVSSGYASINYEYKGYKQAQVTKMDILVAEEIVESLSVICYEDDAQRRGKEIVQTLKDTMPQANVCFEVTSSHWRKDHRG